MTVEDLIKNKDYDFISWRRILPESLGGKDIFIGATKSEGGKLFSLDGDRYLENTEIFSYEEWDNPEDGIKNGLTVYKK